MKESTYFELDLDQRSKRQHSGQDYSRFNKKDSKTNKQSLNLLQHAPTPYTLPNYRLFKVINKYYEFISLLKRTDNFFASAENQIKKEGQQTSTNSKYIEKDVFINKLINYNDRQVDGTANQDQKPYIFALIGSAKSLLPMKTIKKQEKDHRQQSTYNWTSQEWDKKYKGDREQNKMICIELVTPIKYPTHFNNLVSQIKNRKANTNTKYQQGLGFNNEQVEFQQIIKDMAITEENIIKKVVFSKDYYGQNSRLFDHILNSHKSSIESKSFQRKPNDKKNSKKNNPNDEGKQFRTLRTLFCFSGLRLGLWNGELMFFSTSTQNLLNSKLISKNFKNYSYGIIKTQIYQLKRGTYNHYFRSLQKSIGFLYNFLYISDLDNSDPMQLDTQEQKQMKQQMQMQQKLVPMVKNQQNPHVFQEFQSQKPKKKSQFYKQIEKTIYQQMDQLFQELSLNQKKPGVEKVNRDEYEKLGVEPINLFHLIGQHPISGHSNIKFSFTGTIKSFAIYELDFDPKDEYGHDNDKIFDKTNEDQVDKHDREAIQKAIKKKQFEQFLQKKKHDKGSNLKVQNNGNDKSKPKAQIQKDKQKSEIKRNRVPDKDDQYFKNIIQSTNIKRPLITLQKPQEKKQQFPHRSQKKICLSQQAQELVRSYEKKIAKQHQIKQMKEQQYWQKQQQNTYEFKEDQQSDHEKMQDTYCENQQSQSFQIQQLDGKNTQNYIKKQEKNLKEAVNQNNNFQEVANQNNFKEAVNQGNNFQGAVNQNNNANIRNQQPNMPNNSLQKIQFTTNVLNSWYSNKNDLPLYLQSSYNLNTFQLQKQNKKKSRVEILFEEVHRANKQERQKEQRKQKQREQKEKLRILNMPFNQNEDNEKLDILQSIKIDEKKKKSKIRKKEILIQVIQDTDSFLHNYMIGLAKISVKYKVSDEQALLQLLEEGRVCLFKDVNLKLSPKKFQMYFKSKFNSKHKYSHIVPLNKTRLPQIHQDQYKALEISQLDRFAKPALFRNIVKIKVSYEGCEYLHGKMICEYCHNLLRQLKYCRVCQCRAQGKLSLWATVFVADQKLFAKLFLQTPQVFQFFGFNEEDIADIRKRIQLSYDYNVGSIKLYSDYLFDVIQNKRDVKNFQKKLKNTFYQKTIVGIPKYDNYATFKGLTYSKKIDYLGSSRKQSDFLSTQKVCFNGYIRQTSNGQKMFICLKVLYVFDQRQNFNSEK